MITFADNRKDFYSMIDINNSDLNLKEQIHNSLFHSIVTGVYPPGTVLHEKKLMDQYSVSRAPIREALIQLCSERMLVSMPKKGYVVTALSMEDMKNIIAFRQVMECTYLQWFSACITKESIQKLENHLYSLDLSHHGMTAPEHWHLNSQFHLLLFDNYHNPFAYDKLKEALISQTRFYAQERISKWASPVFVDPSSLHFAIVDYLKQGNIKMAVNILKADIEDIIAV